MAGTSRLDADQTGLAVKAGALQWLGQIERACSASLVRATDTRYGLNDDRSLSRAGTDSDGDLPLPTHISGVVRRLQKSAHFPSRRWTN